VVLTAERSELASLQDLVVLLLVVMLVVQSREASIQESVVLLKARSGVVSVQE
jgi:hypothetical protein